MTNPEPLKDVTRLFRDAIDDAGDVEALPAHRDQAIAAIAEALRQRGRAQRRRRWIRLPVLAAAAIVVVGTATYAMRRSPRETAATTTPTRELGRLVEESGAVTAVVNGQAADVAQGASLPEGTELRTSDSSEASLHFESGTHVTLGGGSRVRLVEQTRSKRFALEQGSFSAKVAKLAAGERFVVATSDAEIEVRGTAFRVSIAPSDPACENGTPTRLDVTEGVVVVRHAGAEARVAAGEHWPSCLPTAAATTARPVVPAPSVAVVRTATRPVAPAPSSHLAEQNDLFDEAMRRKRAGDVPGAVAQLDRLLSAYPSGPLAESAATERRRLLAAADAGPR